MGIKSLLPFLSKKCPDAFKDLPYSYFRGKRIATDSNNVFIKLMSRAHKEVVNETDVCTKEPDRTIIVEKWHGHIKEEIVGFMRYGITQIFVFDGKYIEEKSATQKKRREDKAKRLKEAEDMKKKVLELDELERTPQMITELRKKMHHLGTVTKSEWQDIITILKSLGFPVLQATGEGEKLCAMLCIEGKVTSVYSRDSDLVALGCPLSFSGAAGWIYNPETKKTEMALKCTFFKPILSALEMEYVTFLDLCIMSGCDFNDNIPRLGVGTAYKLLKVCKSIENLPNKYDEKKEILNHLRGREIFKRENSKDICTDEIILNLNIETFQSLRESNKNNKIDTLNLNEWIETLAPYYNDFPTPSNIFVEKLPSLTGSAVRMRIVGDDTKNMSPLPLIAPVIPKQAPSPIKMKPTVITSLASQQLANYKEKQSQTKVIKLKILS